MATKDAAIQPINVASRKVRAINAALLKPVKKMSRISTALVLSEQEEQGLRQITRRNRAWLSNAGKDLVRKSLSQGLVGFELLDPLHLLPIPFILRIRCCEPRIQNLLSNGFRSRS